MTDSKKQKGFTLIELLVSLAVFSLVLSMSTGVFVFSLKSQRKSLATQELLDQSSYALEYISRSLRMAQKDLTGECIAAKTNYYVERDDLDYFSRLVFKNYEGECQEFAWEGGQLIERKAGAENLLLADKFLVNWFDVFLTGEGQGDNLQPKVTFAFDLRGEDQANIQVQTTVSQRNADIRE